MENYENIDIKRIFQIVFSKKIFIILIIITSISIGYVYSYYYKKPQYNSTTKILLVADENKEQLTQTDLNINTSLISTYSSIAKSASVIEKTIENLGLNMSVQELQKNIQVAQIDKTQFLKISVTSTNAEMAKNITNELAQVFSNQIKQIYNIDNIKIVDEAEIAKEPYNINHTKDMIMFGIIGIFLSSLLVILIYFIDDTLKDESDVEQKLKIKNIGTLPIDKDNEQLIIKTNPKSHIVECIKTLRTNILYVKNKNTILITSANQQEGKSWIANNLAVALAQTNKRVILVDTDLRKNSDKSEIFKIKNQEGLSDFIKEVSEDKLENLKISTKYIQETDIPNLHILANGTIPPNPSELISSNNMKKILDLLKDMYDLIILDGTPCLLVSDSIALSSMVDSTIIVAESRKTKIHDLKETKKLIQDVNGNVLGIISNKVEAQGGKYYGKTYGYYYGKEELSENEKLEENQKSVSLKEIIKMAEKNIKEENNEVECYEQQEDDKLDENKDQIKYDLYEAKTEIIKELKKIKTEMKKSNYKEKFEEIDNNLTEHRNEYIDKISQINLKIDDSKNEYYKMVEQTKKQEDENLENMLQKFLTEIEKINADIKELKELQNTNNIEVLEKIEKIENTNNQVIYENVETDKTIKEEGNIISFETLKERRKKFAKKVFNINESIKFEDLEKISNCVIDLNEDTSIAVYN